MTSTGGASGALVCSFCGKTQDEVRSLMAGPAVTICDACIRLGHEMLTEDAGDGDREGAGGDRNPTRAAATASDRRHVRFELGPAVPTSALRPPRLEAGDRIAVVAPAGAFDPAALARGVERLRARGFEVVHRADIGERVRYLAGPDRRRASELEEALADPAVKAVLCARGGYGSARALEHTRALASEGLARPKILVGYSDITFLLDALTAATGLVTFHGPQVAVDLAAESFEESLDDLLATLGGKRFPGPFQAKPLAALVPGEAEGTLLGGCLSMLVTMIGTPWEPSFHDSILFLEDIAEPAFRIDRMLTHLRQAGSLDGVRGVVIGYLKDVRAPEGTTIEEVFLDALAPLGIPVAMGLEAGHGSPCRTLPLGVRARLDATAGTLEVLEPVVD